MSDLQLKPTPKHKLLSHRIDHNVLDSLNDDQKDAVSSALNSDKWATDHPINIRLNIPWFNNGYYLTIVGGPEKRSHARRLEEKEFHPVRTFLNILFAIGVVGGASLLMLILLALYSSIIEF